MRYDAADHYSGDDGDRDDHTGVNDTWDYNAIYNNHAPNDINSTPIRRHSPAHRRPNRRF